jgi:hypothetical protein
LQRRNPDDNISGGKALNTPVVLGDKGI